MSVHRLEEVERCARSALSERAPVGKPAAAELRRLRAVIRACCSEPGVLREWLVSVLPVALIPDMEDAFALLAEVGSDPARRVETASCLARIVELLERARSSPAIASAPVEPADVDALTGLRSRRAWDGDLAGACNAVNPDSPLCMLMIDLDHFKEVNDRFGHLAGDEVLRAVGALLRRVVQHRGTAYRWGGEELAVLLPNTGASEAEAVACRVLTGIRELRFATVNLEVTASIGWAAMPHPGVDTPEALVRLADLRLYEAKHAGRNRVWSPDMPRAGHAWPPHPDGRLVHDRSRGRTAGLGGPEGNDVVDFRSGA